MASSAGCFAGVGNASHPPFQLYEAISCTWRLYCDLFVLFGEISSLADLRRRSNLLSGISQKQVQGLALFVPLHDNRHAIILKGAICVIGEGMHLAGRWQQIVRHSVSEEVAQEVQGLLTDSPGHSVTSNRLSKRAQERPDRLVFFA